MVSLGLFVWMDVINNGKVDFFVNIISIVL